MKNGLYGWMNKNLRGRKGQQGFTLIELLVVVTILGILAAIVTLSLVGLTTNASVQSCNQEYKTVQAALDAYMANNNTPPGTLSASTSATGTNNMKTIVALYNDGSVTPLSAANPNYTRNGSTVFYYQWDANGRIYGIFDKSGNKVTGCSVT